MLATYHWRLGASWRNQPMQIVFWTTYAALGGLIIVAFFTGQLGAMLKFAMISAFVSAPIFGWLNYSLVKGEQDISGGINALSIAGLIFLAGFTLLFLANLAGLFA